MKAMLGMFPLVVLLAACGDGKDTDGTDDSDTNDTVDTTDETGSGETGGSSGFVPTSFSYSGDFALTGLEPVEIDLGAPVGPYFQIELADDSGDTCTLYYFLEPEAFAYAGQGNDPDTTADPDVLEWLDAHGAGWGFKVAPGTYTAGGSTDPADRCADLDLAAFNEFLGTTYPDVHEAALQLGGTGTVFFGLNTSVTDEIVQLWEDADTGVDSDLLLGGFLTFAFEIDGSDTVDAFGLWTDIVDGAPANDGTNYIFNDPADAFDDAKGEPADGFFRFFSPTSIVFQ